MLKRVYRIMIKEFNAEEAESAIAQDWERDSRGTGGLSRKLFCDAFFECVKLCPNPCRSASNITY